MLELHAGLLSEATSHVLIFLLLLYWTEAELSEIKLHRQNASTNNENDALGLML